jgi:hypothetical protein
MVELQVDQPDGKEVRLRRRPLADRLQRPRSLVLP